MTIWKSPIFYFGVILVLAVSAALLAPFIVDWNQYRPQIEKYGAQISGRNLRAEGPISVRLFPWPKLSVADVKIDNPNGDGSFAVAERVDIRVTLAGLISGTIQVEAVEVINPKITLVRNSAGVGNWNFSAEQVLRDTKLLDRVKLDTIAIQNGEITFIDEARNVARSVSDVVANFSAPSIDGPWRVSGSMLTGQVPVNFTLTTGAKKANTPLSFGFRIAPLDTSLPVFAFDGGFKENGVAGKIDIQRVLNEDGKENLTGGFPPFMFKADVAADFDQAKLTKIAITMIKKTESASVIEGEAQLVWNTRISTAITLKTPRLDLSDVDGGAMLTQLRSDGGMAILQSMMTAMPENLDVKLDLSASQIDLRTDKFENVKLIASGDHNAIRITELSSGLPGRTRALFDGIAFSADDAAELGGTIAIESQDFRAFSGFLWPEGKAALATNWTGSRGQLKAQSKINLSQTRLGLQALRYALDGAEGKGEVSVRLGENPALDLRLEAPIFDVDRYLPGGVAALSGNQAASWFGLIDQIVQGAVSLEKRLTLQFDRLLLNGVEAKDLVLDFDTSSSGIDIRTLEIGSVGGAGVQASGTIVSSANGPEGNVAVTVKAEDPRSALQLLGLVAANTNPTWMTALGKTDLRINFGVKPGNEEPITDFEIKGTSGEIAIDLSAGVRNLAAGLGSKVSGILDLKSGSSATILRLAGLESFEAQRVPGTADLTFSGSLASGIRTALNAEIFGSAVTFEGDLLPSEMQWRPEGKMSIKSKNVALLARAVGLPAPVAPNTVISSDIDFKPDRSISIVGQLGEGAFSGNVRPGTDQKYLAEFAMDRLNLKDVLGAGLLPWELNIGGMEAAFARNAPFGFQGEIWLRPTALDFGFGVIAKEAQIGMVFEKSERQIAISGRTSDEQPLALTLEMSPKDSMHNVKGRYQLPLDLAAQLKLTSSLPVLAGQLVMEGSFNSVGRNGLAVLSGLSGAGSYQLRDGQLLAFSPQVFTAQLAEIKDATALSALFNALEQGPGMAINDAQGSMTITDGLVAFLPTNTTNADVQLTLKPTGDLVDGTIDLEIDANLKAQADLPAIGLKYSGAPAALSRRSDMTLLSAKLGYAILEKGVVELERVQAEQEKALIEEERLRKIDEERFALFQAQKAELRLRTRELRVHKTSREELAVAAETKRNDRLSLLQNLNKQELALRLRELRVRRGQKAPALVPLKIIVPETLAPKPTAIKPPQNKIILPNKVKLPVVIDAPAPTISPLQ